jgi:hypothetical protein
MCTFRLPKISRQVWRGTEIPADRRQSSGSGDTVGGVSASTGHDARGHRAEDHGVGWMGGTESERAGGEKSVEGKVGEEVSVGQNLSVWAMHQTKFCSVEIKVQAIEYGTWVTAVWKL